MECGLQSACRSVMVSGLKSALRQYRQSDSTSTSAGPSFFNSYSHAPATFHPSPTSCTVMKPEPDEYALALRARAGDREALVALVERTRLRLFALAYAELRHYEDAQDALAAALLQICRHVGELREPQRARAWMYRITRNEARLILRRRAGAALRLEEEDDDRHAGVQQCAAAP